jgi:hypothetical protein
VLPVGGPYFVSKTLKLILPKLHEFWIVEHGIHFLRLLHGLLKGIEALIGPFLIGFHPGRKWVLLVSGFLVCRFLLSRGHDRSPVVFGASYFFVQLQKF